MTRFNELQAKLSPSETYAHPSITRYFDHIQNLPSVRSLNAFPTVTFDLDNAPKIERVAEAPKEKKKEKVVAQEAAQSVPPSASSSAPAAPAAVAPPSNSTPGDSDQKAMKKEKKEKPAKKETSAPADNTKAKGAAPPAAASDSGEPLPSMIDLRVGKIVQGSS
jgi:aminoacyl tRNA synthase complex-interacting multifunctional protein 1